MIIWLASYPRSGNTLLRTVFKQTMDIGSYSDEHMLPSVEHTEIAKQSYGHLTYQGSWDSFYEKATASKDTFLVKTHLPPRDNQPVIYVVRDGRSATESYLAYHLSFIKSAKASSSILKLMLGDDFYGDWSSHFHLWNFSQERPLLLVRFEDLVNVRSDLLEKLGAFVGFTGQPLTFNNPMNALHLQNPNFFRKGTVKWIGSDEWTEKLIDYFIALHGELLVDLGYISILDRNKAFSKLDQLEIDLLKVANRGFTERNVANLDAQSKEKVIQQLLVSKQENVAISKCVQNFLTRLLT